MASETQEIGKVRTNQMPPEGKGWECEPGDYAADGSQLVRRYWLGGTHCIDVFRTKNRKRWHVTRSISDIAGKPLFTTGSAEEADRVWGSEISKALAPKPKSEGQKAVAKGEMWALYKQEAGNWMMPTPEGTVVGTRDELIAARDQWHVWNRQPRTPLV